MNIQNQKKKNANRNTVTCNKKINIQRVFTLINQGPEYEHIFTLLKV